MARNIIYYGFSLPPVTGGDFVSVDHVASLNMLAGRSVVVGPAPDRCAEPGGSVLWERRCGAITRRVPNDVPKRGVGCASRLSWSSPRREADVGGCAPNFQIQTRRTLLRAKLRRCRERIGSISGHTVQASGDQRPIVSRARCGASGLSLQIRPTTIGCTCALLAGSLDVLERHVAARRRIVRRESNI